MINAIEVNNLTKIYNPKSKNAVTALSDFSLTVETGKIFGLLGPNGAGKTTLIKILLGIVFQNSGDAKILEEDISNYKVRTRIGYLPENHKFPNYLNGEDLLKYYAKLSGYNENDLSKRIDELLALVKMNKWRKTKVKKYSKGMLQRIGLAQALIHNPDLIFLDEPTDGVDPIGRKEIRDILISLKNEGKTIFVNSHLLSEVELISDRVAILNNGKLIKEGSVEEFTTQKEVYEVKLNKEFDSDLITNLLKSYEIFEIKKESFKVKVKDETELDKITDLLRQHDLGIRNLNNIKTSLEDIFINLINKN